MPFKLNFTKNGAYSIRNLIYFNLPTHYLTLPLYFIYYAFAQVSYGIKKMKKNGKICVHVHFKRKKK